MRRTLKDRAVLFALSFFFLLVLACDKKRENKTAGKEHSQYTCPMHPEIVREAPGTCPVCGMDLVALQRHEASGSVTDSLKSLLRPVDEVVVSNMKTVKPQKGSRFKELEFPGVINYNTNNKNIVSARVGGRIEKLYVKYNFQQVSKGQKLMELYSPDLAAAQQELLFLRNNGDPTLLQAARQKMRLLGGSEQLIRSVLKNGKISYTVPVYSPYSGYLAESDSSPAALAAPPATPANAPGSMEGMGGDTPPAPKATPATERGSQLLLREGQYIAPGQALFNIVNTNSVWAEFYADAQSLAALRTATAVKVEATHDENLKVTAGVSLIQPYYREGSSFSLVRASISNSRHQWKVGQLLNVKIEGFKLMGNWVPRSAVLQLGTRSVCFVRQGKVFVPRYVQVLSEAADWLDIGSGVESGQELALNAWFLVDSESFVKAGGVINEK